MFDRPKRDSGMISILVADLSLIYDLL